MRIVTGYKGEPHITSNDDQGRNQGTFGSGAYVLSTGSRFAVTAVTANEIQIADGEAVFQGIHFRIDPSTYDTVTIDNGTQGYKRKDLIVCRYTKDALTGIETMEWAVKKGTPATTSPTRPSVTTGDILSGAVLAEAAFFEVVLDGINLTAINKLYTDIMPMDALTNGVGSLAVIETSPATAAHAAGTYLVYNGILYRVKTAISIGETLTAGSNIVATTEGAEIVSRTGYTYTNVASLFSDSTYIHITSAVIHLIGKRFLTLYLTATVSTAMTAGLTYDLMTLPTKLIPTTLSGTATVDFTGALFTNGTVRINPRTSFSVSNNFYFTATYILAADYS